MTAGELLVKLGFEVDTMRLNEFIKDLGELNLSSVIAAAGLKGIVDGLTDIMKTADGVASSLNKISGITGVQQQIFQQWDQAAQEFNLSAGETTGILSDIQKQINLLKVGQGSAVAWSQLFHIPVAGRENDPAGVFHDILKSMEGMDPVQRRLLLNMAGINEDAALLVGHEDEILNKVHNTNEEFGVLAEYHKKIRDLTNEWTVLLTSIGAAIAPILTPLIELINDLLTIIIHLEQGIPKLLKDLGAAAVLFGVLLNLAKILFGVINPAVAIGSGVLAGGAFLLDVLKPSNTSSVTNGGDINQTNNYNIQGNDPNSIARRIQETHEAQMRDVQGQSPLTSY